MDPYDFGILFFAMPPQAMPSTPHYEPLPSYNPVRAGTEAGGNYKFQGRNTGDDIGNENPRRLNNAISWMFRYNDVSEDGMGESSDLSIDSQSHAFENQKQWYQDLNIDTRQPATETPRATRSLEQLKRPVLIQISFYLPFYSSSHKHPDYTFEYLRSHIRLCLPSVLLLSKQAISPALSADRQSTRKKPTLKQHITW